jgi:ribosomal protein L10
MKKWLKEEIEDLKKLINKEGNNAIKSFSELSNRNIREVREKARELKLIETKKC